MSKNTSNKSKKYKANKKSLDELIKQRDNVNIKINNINQDIQYKLKEIMDGDVSKSMIGDFSLRLFDLLDAIRYLVRVNGRIRNKQYKLIEIKE